MTTLVTHMQWQHIWNTHRIKVSEQTLRNIYLSGEMGQHKYNIKLSTIIYDAFSSIVLFQLESFGLCAPGEAKDFVKGGNLGLGGRLPTNTHGGQLSEAYVHGINGVNEGVRLVRGESCNQPEKNDHVLVTAGVGVPTSAMILGQAD